MSVRMVVHETVHEKAAELAEERGITMKEAVRDVFQEAEYDV